MEPKSGKSDSSRLPQSQKRKLKDRSPSTTTRIFFAPKVCSCCVQPLGLFLSRGSNCPKCGQKVCKKCKVYNQHTSLWNCLLCSKKIQVYGNPGGSTSTPQITTRATDQTPFSTIKRSWSISTTNRSSPVLKSYTKYSDDRQFNSLPRMPSNYHEPPQISRNGNHQNQVISSTKTHHNTNNGANKRKKVSLLSQAFSTTLHPFLPSQYRKSPSSSINFIEDEYWDYWDEYEFRSNRSSCERSLGESVEYQHSFNTNTPPKKPERRKSRSMGAFDTKYSTLKQYCLVNTSQAQPVVHSSSLPRKKKKSEIAEKENIYQNSNPNSIQLRRIPNQTQTPHAYSDNVYLEGTNVHFNTLPRRDREPSAPLKPTHNSTLPKAWKLGTNRPITTSTTLINPDRPRTIERTTTLLNAQEDVHPTQNIIRTIEPPTSTSTTQEMLPPPPILSKKRELPMSPRKVRTDYMTKETYPLFAKRPLILLSADIEHACFPESNPNVNTDNTDNSVKNSDKANGPREVIISIELESTASNSRDKSAAVLPLPPSFESIATASNSRDSQTSAAVVQPSSVTTAEEGIMDMDIPRIRLDKSDPGIYSSSDSSCHSFPDTDEHEPTQISETLSTWPCELWTLGATQDDFQSCLESEGEEEPVVERVGGDRSAAAGCSDVRVEGRSETTTIDQVPKIEYNEKNGEPHPNPPDESTPTTGLIGLSDQTLISNRSKRSENGNGPSYSSSSSSYDEDDERRTTTSSATTVVEAQASSISETLSGSGTSMSNLSISVHPNRKYKSRVLVNGDNADPQEALIEISGEGVEIVTGVGVGVGPYCTVPALHYKEQRRPSPVRFIPIRREGAEVGGDSGQGQGGQARDPVTIIEISSSTRNINHELAETEQRTTTNEPENSEKGCRESPEGEEAQKPSSPMVPPEPAPPSAPDTAPTLKRSSPDGAYECEDSDNSSPTPVLEMNSGSEGEDSTDSWTEEVSFEDTEHPAPLDLTLHTIVEESCEESEPEPMMTKSNLNELEKYYNFTVDPVQGSNAQAHPYEESEFSDTLSESNCSFNSELRNSLDVEELGDPVDLASGRLEKYFMNLGGLSNDSDSVGSESETDSRIVENRKKVLKHHRRSAEFEDELQLVSEDDDSAFHQEGIDTIKKQRKVRRSSEDLLDAQDAAQVKPSPAQTSPKSSEDMVRKEPISVSRSNSFTWSSDEEVNLMMHKLRQLIKNLAKSKKPDEEKNEKLIYLENELIRLMKNEQSVKNIVDTISSDEDDFEAGEITPPVVQPSASPSSNPILSKLSSHIGQRLSTWMQESELIMGEPGAMKCAPSVSSDLNEDRFSWKGSFESTLAKRQSVGSSDSIDDGAVGSFPEGPEVFTDRSILRSSSLHHLANSQPILEESESLTSSLSRLHSPPPSSSSSSSRNSSNINRAKSLFLSQQQIKSARYRPPSYFENSGKDSNHASTPVLSTFQVKEDEARHLESSNLNQIKIRGQVEFLMQYNYKQTNFELCVKQCRDLAAVDVKRGRSDPYVKAYLLPDRTKGSKRKTKTKKNTLNPVFGETLKFPISLEELQGRTLLLSAWHSDIFGKNEFLGQVMLSLRDVTFDETNYAWYTLCEQQIPAEDTGGSPTSSEIMDTHVPDMDLVVALKWITRSFKKGNLTLLLKEAKGLPLFKNSLPSTFVKCTPISDKSKKQKTTLCRKTLTPVWNATMSFENISSDGLEITLYNSELLNHEQIGSFKLDYDSELWREMGRREGFWVEGVIRLT